MMGSGTPAAAMAVAPPMRNEWPEMGPGSGAKGSKVATLRTMSETVASDKRPPRGQRKSGVSEGDGGRLRR